VIVTLPHRFTRDNKEKTPAEQAGSSNGGQRLSLNSGFPCRRGWPIRSREFHGYAHSDESTQLEGGFFCPMDCIVPLSSLASARVLAGFFRPQVFVAPRSSQALARVALRSFCFLLDSEPLEFCFANKS
jgi:hypothetical protein